MARKEKILIKFNNAIYSKKAIKKAISDYSHIARFRAKQTGRYVNITIDEIDAKLKDKLADEFSNYALGMTKTCR